MTLAPPKDPAAIRVGLALVEPFVIDTKITIGRVLLGSKISKMIWNSQKGLFAVFHMLMYLSGFTIGGLALFKMLPYQYSWFAVLTNIPVLAMLSTSNYSLLLRVTKSFNFLLLFGYLTTATVALCVSFSDERIIGMFSAYLGFIVLMLGDALPDKIRREGALFGSTAILILTICICYALFQE